MSFSHKHKEVRRVDVGKTKDKDTVEFSTNGCPKGWDIKPYTCGEGLTTTGAVQNACRLSGAGAAATASAGWIGIKKNCNKIQTDTDLVTTNTTDFKCILEPLNIGTTPSLGGSGIYCENPNFILKCGGETCNNTTATECKTREGAGRTVISTCPAV